MMGHQSDGQDHLFYAFNLEDHVPPDHLLRGIDRFLDLGDLRQHLAQFYSHTGRPSIDPELMIRMLIIGYCFGIRSERRLCEEVHLDLAYRWFCRFSLTDKVPDHSTFSKNRHGRFRDSEAFRQLFESVLQRCMAEGLVGGEGFAVDASVVKADASRQRHREPDDDERGSGGKSRAVREYLQALDEDSPYSGKPGKKISLTDPGASYTAAPGGPAFYAYSDNYLIDTAHGIIMDVEATTANKAQKDGTFSRSDFQWDERRNEYRCPAGKALRSRQRNFKKLPTLVTQGNRINYRASKLDCELCSLKQCCCPNTPARRITHSIHEAARDTARRIAKTKAYKQSCKDRKKVEMLFAHLKRILKLGRLRLRGLSGPRDEFLLAATTQNLRRMVKLLSQPPPIQGVTAPA